MLDTAFEGLPIIGRLDFTTDTSMGKRVRHREGSFDPAMVWRGGGYHMRHGRSPRIYKTRANGSAGTGGTGPGLGLDGNTGTCGLRDSISEFSLGIWIIQSCPRSRPVLMVPEKYSLRKKVESRHRH